MTPVSKELFELAQRCKEAEDLADFYRGWIEKLAESATDEEADAWDKNADDFPGYIELTSVILQARKVLKLGPPKAKKWACPIKKIGCVSNCGNYGCGN